MGTYSPLCWGCSWSCITCVSRTGEAGIGCGVCLYSMGLPWLGCCKILTKCALRCELGQSVGCDAITPDGLERISKQLGMAAVDINHMLLTH